MAKKPAADRQYSLDLSTKTAPGVVNGAPVENRASSENRVIPITDALKRRRSKEMEKLYSSILERARHLF
jgi:hypothetical protein